MRFPKKPLLPESLANPQDPVRLFFGPSVLIRQATRMNEFLMASQNNFDENQFKQ